MAICEWCTREMTEHVSCTVTEFHLNGVPYPLPPNRSRRDCGDCGTPPRGHHHPGCDTALCPLCNRPMFSCGQRFDEDGPDDSLGDIDFEEDDLDDEFVWPHEVTPITAAVRDGFRPQQGSWTPQP